jgi:hypothetical protein
MQHHGRELANRRQAKVSMRARDLESQRILDGIPSPLVSIAPTGGVERIDRQLLDYAGAIVVDF